MTTAGLDQMNSHLENHETTISDEFIHHIFLSDSEDSYVSELEGLKQKLVFDLWKIQVSFSQI